MSKLNHTRSSQEVRRGRQTLVESQKDQRMIDMRTRQRLTPEEVSRMADDLLRRHRAK